MNRVWNHSLSISPCSVSRLFMFSSVRWSCACVCVCVCVCVCMFCQRFDRHLDGVVEALAVIRPRSFPNRRNVQWYLKACEQASNIAIRTGQGGMLHTSRTNDCSLRCKYCLHCCTSTADTYQETGCLVVEFVHTIGGTVAVAVVGLAGNMHNTSAQVIQSNAEYIHDESHGCVHTVA